MWKATRAGAPSALSRDIGLDTHVADVTNLMIWEDFRDVVLVGHSYGGVGATRLCYLSLAPLKNATLG
jgi:hypothetical protein